MLASCGMELLLWLFAAVGQGGVYNNPGRAPAILDALTWSDGMAQRPSGEAQPGRELPHQPRP